MDKDKINTSVTTLFEREVFKICIKRSVDKIKNKNNNLLKGCETNATNH